jgi:hypothetical protein
MTPSPVALSIGLLIAVLADASPAGAQSGLRPYAGGSVGSFSVSADEAEGRSASGGLFTGVALAKYVDVEFDLVFPASSFTRTYTGASVSFAPAGASPAEHDRLSVITRFDKEREVSASISAVVIIHPTAVQRVTPGLIVGLTSQRARDRTVYTPISIPEGINPEHPAVVGRTESSARNIGGPTIGGQLAIAVTPRLSIVPDVRYDYGSIGDEINNTLRVSARVQWRF